MGQGNPQLIRPTCWTRWIQDNKNQLKYLSSCSHHYLKMRDTRFRYTIVHALMAGDIEDKEVIRQCFNVLRKKSLISLITAKDKEGDTPLHSAIRSGTKPEIIKLLMNTISGMTTKRRLLLEQNKRGELPIVSAFNLQRWPIVEVLLEKCIRCQVLPKLTGVGGDVSSKESKSLLLKAMKRGFIRYIKIYLDVYRRCKNSTPVQAMLIPDKWGRTPWYYFLSLDVKQIEEGLEYLKEHKVNVNKLLCDRTGRTGLLHEAFRRDNGDLCDLLVKYGANRDQRDANNLSPPQRKRIISLRDSTPASPVHRNERPVGIPRRIIAPREAETEVNMELEVRSEEERDGGERIEEEGDEEERVEVETNVDERDGDERVEVERDGEDRFEEGREGGAEDQISDIERRWVQREEQDSCDVKEDFNLQRTEGVDASNAPTDNEVSKPQTVADPKGTPPAVRLNLLNALDLEMRLWRKSFTGLSPREEETAGSSIALYVATRPLRIPLRLSCFNKCFVAHNGEHLIMLKWYAPTPSFFTEVKDWHQGQPEPKEQELCPIYDVNSTNTVYIASFNTRSSIP